jgi:hypothetical protein
MILSHKWRFIFVKNKKVAGTSVEAFLAPTLGPMDVITPLRPTDESVRYTTGDSPQNWLSIKVDLDKIGNDGSDPDSVQATYWKIGLNRIGTKQQAAENPEHFLKLERQFYHHITANEILDVIPRWMWDEYFTFCIERHPYEKAVSSAYWYIRAQQKDISFHEALDIVVEQKRFKDWHRYTDSNGNVIVDKIIRYENLADEMRQTVVDQLGIDVSIGLPKLKSESRSDRRPAAEILSVEQKQKVRAVMEEEFDYFDWQI